MSKMQRISLHTVFACIFLLAATACSKNIYDFEPASGNTNFVYSDAEFIKNYESIAKSYKIGKPYKINNNWFYPQHQPNYSEVGMASWYGPNVGAHTASGEAFDTSDFTAAHPTLPLPSIVAVTNLKNGKRVIVRVNDRGPFSRSRIIDVSEAAAAELGMLGAGTAKVKVELLQEETLRYLRHERQQAALETKNN